MPAPTLITDLSTTQASNYPSGSDNVFPSLDDTLRALSGFVASIRDNSGNGWVSPYLPLAGGTVTGATTFSSTVALNGALSGTGLTTYLASPPAIGGTTPNTGAFTTLAASSDLTLSGGTANGVLYLNGSKVATSGSALTFDGTNFTTTGYAAGNGIRSLGGNAVRFYNSANANWSQISAPVGTGDMQFDTGAGEQMRLTSTGLGIGTSSPGYRLSVAGPGGTGNCTISLVDTSNSNKEYRIDQSSGQFRVIESGVAEQLILTAGNLGLGVTPSAWDTATFRTLQVGSGVGSVSLSGRTDNGKDLVLGSNIYYATGSFRYVGTGVATMYRQDGAEHQWFTAPSGTAGNAISFTQAMTLDASGNLLIGRTASSGSPYKIEIDTTSDTRIGFNVNTTLTGILQATTNNFSVAAAGASGVLTFNTNSTERARITSGGEFVIGATAAVSSEKLYVNGSNTEYLVRWYNTNASPKGLVMSYTGAAPNGTGNSFLRCDDTGALRAEFRSNGGLANYSANDANLSDRREKTNFAPAKSYLDTICAIPVQTFNYIDQSEDDPGLTLGVVAQDVQAVAPELVMESNWGTAEDPKMRLSIYQTDLQYALMKCIQELKAQNDELRARVAALESN